MDVLVSEIGPHWYTSLPLWVWKPAPGMTLKKKSSMTNTDSATTTATVVPIFNSLRADA